MSEPAPIADAMAEFKQALGVTELRPSQPPDIAGMVREQRMACFKKLCPEEFRQPIDRSKIPNLRAWDEADGWDGSFPGRWLWSHETGEAKTRMIWRQFGRFHVERGMSVQRTTGLNLSEEYHDLWQRSQTSRFYRDVCCTDVIMFDDLDKMLLPAENQGFAERTVADRNARMLRELFDSFYEERQRVLITANEPIEWFGARIGESAARRMRAVCVEIPF